MKTVDIVTVAFNNADILNIQYQFLKRNLKNAFVYHILDNSTNDGISNIIKKFCTIYEIDYIKTNTDHTDFSISHGLAINDLLGKIVFEKELLLFLDHDIIPIKEINLDDNLGDSDFYGLKQINAVANNWYLRPVLFLCKNDLKYVKALNFLPCKGADSGGSNYETLFKYLPEGKVTDVKDFKYYSLTKSIDNFKHHVFIMHQLHDNIQQYHGDNDLSECMDGWLHFINTSDWNNKGSKMDKIIEFTDLLFNKLDI